MYSHVCISLLFEVLNEFDLENYHGQPDAVQIVETFFKTNVHVRQKPRLLHFSGPSGVGKTYLAMLMGSFHR